METEEFRVSALISASPNRIYSAWMDERQHSAFTGGRSTIDPWVGGRHTAWDNYVEGSLVELDTGRRIVMTWRTTEFPKTAHDSKVEITLEPVAGGTRVAVHHTDIPEGQADQYKKYWRSSYLDPMKRYFGKPGAMRAALKAASKAGVLPIPGVTSARPGTQHRPAMARPPEPEEADEAANSKSPSASKKKSAAKKKSAPKKKTASKKKSAPKKKTASKKKSAPKKKTASKKKSAPKKKTASKKKSAPKKKTASKKKSAKKRPASKKKTGSRARRKR